MIDILLAIQAIEDTAEREYIGELFEKYSKKVKRLAFNILKNEQDAEDAVGITFLKIIRYRDKFMGIEENQVKGRISLITRCACFDCLDKREKNRCVSMTEAAGDDEGNSNDMEIADDIDLLHYFQECYNFVGIIDDRMYCFLNPYKVPNEISQNLNFEDYSYGENVMFED